MMHRKAITARSTGAVDRRPVPVAPHNTSWHPRVAPLTQQTAAQIFRRRALRLWHALLAVLLATPILGGPFHAARAQGDGETGVLPQQMQTGSLLLQMRAGYTTATRINTDVTIRVSGTVSRSTLSQNFRNDGAEWVEGIYVFPLPDNAAVDRLRIRIGERVIEGEIREREQASAEYAQAKKEGRRAGLVEQQRSNLFTTSIANIGPGETVVVEVEYLETLGYDDGQFSLRFPLTLTPRYIPGTPVADRQGSGWSPDTRRVPDASLITPPVVTQSTDHSFSMHAIIDAGTALDVIASRYHPVTVAVVDESAGVYEVTLTDGTAPMDHDLELVWRPVTDSMARAALFREDKGGIPHLLLMVLPPDDMAGDQATAVESMPRDLVFVIDTSGSMHGTSMQQAKQALLLALPGLRPNDRFNVIQFNSVTDTLFPASVPASPGNIRLARNYVQSLTANGGTEMRPALERALVSNGDEAHLRQIVFVTDGSVGNEQELFALIEERLGHSRLFTVGIGSAPNSLFMHKAAEAGRGTYTFISALHEVQEKMGRLIRKIEQPRVTGISVEWPGSAVAYPEVVPDLYAGEPIVQKVRLLAEPRPGDIVRVSGTSAMGDWVTELPIAHEGDNAGIAAVWGRARIEHLMDRERRGDDPARIRAAVLETALDHSLVSRYTSFVAIDKTPARPQSSRLDSELVPNLLPYGQSQGQSQQAISGFPATATGWVSRVTVGVLLLLVAMFLIAGRTGRRIPRVQAVS
jgi:Ca-activated chloride channel family protein